MLREAQYYMVAKGTDDEYMKLLETTPGIE